MSDPVRQSLREFILANFLPGEAPETLDDSTLLVTSGVISSLSMVELVTFIEDRFELTLEEEDISVTRMDSVDLLVELVAERATPAPDPAQTPG